RQARAVRRAMDERATRVVSASRALPRPDDVLALARQRFDAAAGRLAQGLRANLNEHRSGFAHLANRLSERPLKNQIDLHRQALQRLDLQSGRAIRHDLETRTQRLAASTKLLGSLSYERVVQRGFAVIRNEKDVPLSSAGAARKAGRLSLEFHDGRVGVLVDGAKPEKRAPKSKPAKPGSGSSQGKLF
ncbi:MAG: exodeoxyribonuclease VII large subunit, partial [Aestuariivirgaceae bacterium]